MQALSTGNTQQIYGPWPDHNTNRHSVAEFFGTLLFLHILCSRHIIKSDSVAGAELTKIFAVGFHWSDFSENEPQILVSPPCTINNRCATGLICCGSMSELPPRLQRLKLVPVVNNRFQKLMFVHVKSVKTFGHIYCKLQEGSSITLILYCVWGEKLWKVLFCSTGSTDLRDLVDSRLSTNLVDYRPERR